jgi:hypothetical protein
VLLLISDEAMGHFLKKSGSEGILANKHEYVT